MLKELRRIITHDERRVLSSTDIAELTGIVNTLLTVYADEPMEVRPQPDEARRAPVRPSSREHWWQKLSL